MSIALITGGSGHVGSNLVRKLTEKGYKIRTIDFDGDHRAFEGFDVELVCETFVRGDTYFPTEKTTRPLAGGKPMIIYGPKDYLARLRDQGFKTWGDCWDESYDEYEGLGRWMRIKEVIIQNNDWNVQEWKSIVKKANAIAQYNQEFFMQEVANGYNY